MTIIIDGTNSVMGRLASLVAKEALLGEEIIILNCDKVIISGNRKNIREEFYAQREKIGSGQKGPKHARVPYMIVKRAIRGMLSHRQGRGKAAFQRIKCFPGVPLEYKDAKTINVANERKIKFIHVGELRKGN